MKRLLPIVALATNCWFAPILAQDIQVAIPVDRADLDLTSLRDISLLDARIARAAARACGAPSVVDLHAANAHAHCTRGAIAAVRARRDRAIQEPRPVTKMRQAM